MYIYIALYVYRYIYYRIPWRMYTASAHASSTCRARESHTSGYEPCRAVAGEVPEVARGVECFGTRCTSW